MNQRTDDLYEIYRDAPGRYTTTTFDKNNENNEEFSNNLFESEHEISQNLPEPLPKNNFEPLQAQDPSVIPTEPTSIQKLPLIDDEIQNHLTSNKKTDIPMLLLSTNLTLESKRHKYFGF